MQSLEMSLLRIESRRDYGAHEIRGIAIRIGWHEKRLSNEPISARDRISTPTTQAKAWLQSRTTTSICKSFDRWIHLIDIR